MKTIIKNVNVITPFDVIYGGEILIEEGKIKRIDQKNGLNEVESNEIIDGKGQF